MVGKFSDWLKGTPEELTQAKTKHEELHYRLELLQGDLSLRKSMGKIPDILFTEAQKQINEAKQVLEGLKKSIDLAGKEPQRLKLVLSDRVPDVEKVLSDIQDSTERYMNAVEKIKRTRERFKSMKDFWEQSRSVSVASIKNLERIIDNYERQLKDIEDEMSNTMPTPERHLPLVTRYEAMKDILSNPERGLKQDLMVEQLRMTTYDVSINNAEIADMRMDNMQRRFETEGQRFFLDLASGKEVSELIEIGDILRIADASASDLMGELARTLGPDTPTVSPQVTKERMERNIEEWVVKMKAIWEEEGWDEQKIAEQSEIVKQKLLKEWEPLF